MSRIDEIRDRLDYGTNGGSALSGPDCPKLYQDIAFLLAEVRRLEEERDAALRAVADVATRISTGGFVAPWFYDHAAVIEAARKMGDE